MTVRRELYRLVAASVFAGAVALLSITGPLSAETETGTCGASTGFFACVARGTPGTFTQGQVCTSGNCYTCHAHAGLRCAPVGTGVSELDWSEGEHQD